MTTSTLRSRLASWGQSPWLWRYRIVFAVVALCLVLAADQASKLYMRHHLAAPIQSTVDDEDPTVNYRATREFVLVRGLWHHRYVENPSSAFGLTRWIPDWLRRPLLTGINFIAALLLLVWLVRLKQPDAILVVGLPLVAAGALGNGIDRLAHGYVIDFVVWTVKRWWPSIPEWPTFNVADTAIVCGAICILLRSLLPLEPEPEIAPSEQA
ncbi:MAG: signal peptidase II [Deltaproteobacteria bacterium]|nr:signal peptidase II [Deltaproteobacteria bacterium]